MRLKVVQLRFNMVFYDIKHLLVEFFVYNLQSDDGFTERLGNIWKKH
jgi:hypothetical protein